LNGHFLGDVAPVVTGQDEVAFKPTRSDASKGFWDELWGGHLLEQRALSVAVGLEDASVLVPAPTNLVMHPLQGTRAFLLVVAALLLVGLTVTLAITTDIVRDGRKPEKGKLPTYSLGRTQMAFWFVNVVLAVLLIWAVTGAVPPITSSVLSLIGIGAGTALGAVLVDQSDTATMPPKDSRNFLMDVLSDGGAIRAAPVPDVRLDPGAVLRLLGRGLESTRAAGLRQHAAGSAGDQRRHVPGLQVPREPSVDQDLTRHG
jgi:hypothetical protein